MQVFVSFILLCIQSFFHLLLSIYLFWLTLLRLSNYSSETKSIYSCLRSLCNELIIRFWWFENIVFFIWRDSKTEVEVWCIICINVTPWKFSLFFHHREKTFHAIRFKIYYCLRFKRVNKKHIDFKVKINDILTACIFIRNKQYNYEI